MGFTALELLVAFVGAAVIVTIAAAVMGSKRKERPARGRRAGGESTADDARALLRSVLEASLQGVVVLDPISDRGIISDFRISVVNAAAARMIGKHVGLLRNQTVFESLPCIGKSDLLGKLVSVVESGLPLDDYQQHDDRSDSWYDVYATKFRDGVLVTFADVTRRRRAEDKLRYAALHDGLTGLPNRVLFAEKLTEAIARTQRDPQRRYAVMFLDFDRFKIINDSLGHDVGDGLLTSIAERLRTNLRAPDISTQVGDGPMPARIGGDEFLVLLEGMAPAFDPIAVADRLQEALSKPHEIDGHSVVSTASIGIVTSDDESTSPDEIIRRADAAMYKSKQTGKAKNTIFDEQMQREEQEAEAWAEELRKAVDENLFTLAYEPVVRLRSGEIARCEALLRWAHPTRGTVFAGEFIGQLDEQGLLPNITSHVLGTACAQAKQWREQWERDDFSVAINLSQTQLQDPELETHVRDALKKNGLPPTALLFEIAESQLAGRDADVETVLTALREMGVPLAIDDFGSGAASIGDLSNLPIAVVKLDRGLVIRPERKREMASVVRAVVELSRELGLEVIAEGIEDRDHMALLNALGCEFGQGHFFGTAAGTELVESMLSQEAALRAA